MSKKRLNSLTFTLSNLRSLLDLNPSPVSFDSLVKAFNLKSSDQDQLRSALETLQKDRRVKQDIRGRYQSTKPISDIVIARLKETPQGSRVEIDIMGLKQEQIVPAFLSMGQIKKLEKKTGSKITKHSHVAVVLERKGAELKVKRILGKIKSDTPIRLTVTFAKASSDRKKVQALDPVSLTFFTADTSALLSGVDLRHEYTAVLSRNFDPYEPSVIVENPRWNAKTGTPIYFHVARQNGLSLRHSPETLKEAEKRTNSDITKQSDLYDLRNERILVIDPAYAHDHDDGILIERSSRIINGQKAAYRTLTVIADMPFFVRPGSYMDEEASKRGFSHYFGKDAIHLYPDILPCNKASLRTGQLRRVIFVEKFYDDTHKPISVANIGVGLIQSQRVLSYGQFQDMCDTNHGDVWAYQELGSTLVSNFRQEGGLVLDSTNHDTRASFSQALVQSMMLDAGTELADFLYSNRIPFLRRVHGANQNALSYAESKAQLDNLGYHLPQDPMNLSINELQFLLSEAELKGEREAIELIVRKNLLHQAVYSTLDLGHFALNIPRYGHFTSPIRRYPDLINLRGVHTALGNDKLGLSEKDIERMEQIAASMNTLQITNKNAAKDYERFHSVSRLAGHEGDTRTVTLSGIQDGYVFLDMTLSRQGSLRKSIPFSDLPQGWHVHQSHKALVYQGNIFIPVGEKLKLTISKVIPECGEWEFENLIPKNIPKIDHVPPRRLVV
ncbi:MAG: RNB domain-containing ribonuclease [Alphaproteobacteria bacterium]|nr:RNB domain-containing ribonuclease [Alphaproteobacteria bacterium]NCQ88923.1 RNB domain-containing ribonuclease [Alphaproteobacteria bacterium]NCT07825.1 RNB domain-containing ribonuclease [Alphaproteobacteria bacterium]